MQNQEFIVCVSHTPWSGVYQKAVVQLMTELACRHQVLFVDYQYTVKDWLLGVLGRNEAPVWEIIRFKKPLTRKTLENGAEVYVWVPPMAMVVNWMPNGWHDRFMGWNSAVLLNGLKRVLRKVNPKHPLVVNSYNPVWGLPMLGKLNEKGTIYYCYDEITAGQWIARHGGRYEREYLRRVDAVVTTSETLQKSKGQFNPNTFCVKNGANYTLFRQAEQLAHHVDRSKKIVGYLGTSDNRLDLDLLEHCLKSLPETIFQFIGRITDSTVVERLSSFPNVEFIKPVPPHELPPLLAKLHAGIIPFQCNDHTYTIYPLKINEYLAAGIPVISTRFSTLGEFEEVVKLTNDPGQFVDGIRNALEEISPERIKQRVRTAETNSWAQRAFEFENVIQHVFYPETQTQVVNHSFVTYAVDS